MSDGLIHLSNSSSDTNFTREIVDESDVYVDVHKAIRRLTPAPRARRIEAAAAAASIKKTTEHPVLVDIAEDANGNTIQVGSFGAQSDSGAGDNRPRTAIFMRRRSSADPAGRMEGETEAIRGSLQDVKQQLRLGPANRAAKPLQARKGEMFKTKQAVAGTQASGSGDRMPPRSTSETALAGVSRARSNENTPLLQRRDTEDQETDHSKTNGGNQ